MRPTLLALGLVALLLTGVLSLAPPAHAQAVPSTTSSSPPLTGQIRGPSELALNTNGTYTLNGSGGVAVQFGKFIGKITWSVTLSAVDLTGVSVNPSNGTFKNGSAATVTLTVGKFAETVTLELHLTSLFGTQKSYANVTDSVSVLTPYIVSAKLNAGPNAVMPFKVLVTLDGRLIGNVSVPGLNALQSYTVTFRYPSGSLAAGHHTFELSVADEHGLVSFSGGRSTVSATFYVAGAPPNNALWYAAGTVAFFGALFIFATRVAARRRGSGRR